MCSPHGLRILVVISLGFSMQNRGTITCHLKHKCSCVTILQCGKN